MKLYLLRLNIQLKRIKLYLLIKDNLNITTFNEINTIYLWSIIINYIFEIMNLNVYCVDIINQQLNNKNLLDKSI